MTPYQTKQLKSNELIDRLNVCTTSHFLDEMELRRIQQQAAKLTEQGGAFAASGYFLLGAISAIRVNKAEVDRCFKAALMLSDADNYPVYKLNYVIASQRTYGIRQAADLCQELATSYPDDIGILKQAIDCADAACRFELGKSLRVRLTALDVDHEDDSTRNVGPMLSRMTDFGLSEDDLLARIEVAGGLLLDKGFRYMGTELFIDDSGESLYSFKLIINSSTAADLNFEIAEELVGRFSDPMENVLSICVVPYSKRGAVE